MQKNLITFYLRTIKGLDSCARIADFSFQRHRDKTFLIQPETGLKITFGILESKVKTAISDMAALGLQKGDVLAFQDLNSPDYFTARLACHYAGVVFLALPQSLKEETVSFFLCKAGAKAIFRNGRPENMITNCAKNIPGIATLNLSSGTTKQTPKIVQLTDSNWVESLYGFLAASNTNPDEKIVFLCTLPFVTAGSTTLLPSLLAGATQIVIRENPNPQTLVEYIKKYEVNQLYITPSRLFELLKYCKAEGTRLSSLKKIITGTERAPAIRLKEAVDFFGAKIHVGYGMVEALPPITMLAPGDYEKLDTVGKPVAGVEIKIMPDSRIAVKTKTVSPGYLENPDENRAFADGWFYTSDHGYIDSDGYLYVLGRNEEVLSERPRMLYAAELEDEVYNIHEVDRCAAIRKNGRVVVFISLRAGIAKAELEKVVSPLIDAQIAIKDELPINSLGKLDRRALLEEIA